MPERNLGGEACKSVALHDAGSRNSKVLVDDDNLLRRPAERSGLGNQSILALCRLAIVLDLSGRGLPEVKVSGAGEMADADLSPRHSLVASVCLATSKACAMMRARMSRASARALASS